MKFGTHVPFEQGQELFPSEYIRDPIRMEDNSKWPQPKCDNQGFYLDPSSYRGASYAKGVRAAREFEKAMDDTTLEITLALRRHARGEWGLQVYPDAEISVET
jgi:hypothetical protein